MKFAAFLLAAVPVLAQAPPGVTPAWELKKQLDALVVQTRRLTPLINEVKAQDWEAASYREQHKAAKDQVEYLARSAAALASDPEKMTLALDTFLRLEALEKLFDSLSEGVRRYQNPALADLMQSTLSENSAHRAKLQNYLIELVTTKQHELRVANDEAQGCRAAALNPTASKRPAANTKKP